LRKTDTLGFTWTTHWTGNATLMLLIRKDINNRRDFLRKLRSFNICSKMLQSFYKSEVERAIFCAKSVAASKPETQGNFTDEEK